MTIKELKEIIKDWPEVNYLGEPTEVWVMKELDWRSNMCTGYSRLNTRVDSEGAWSGDILLEFKGVEND